VRHRIVTVAMKVTALAIALFALPLAAAVYLFFLSNERAELDRAAVLSAATVGPDYEVGDRVTLPQTEGDIQVGLYSPAGRLISGQGPASADPAVARAAAGRPQQTTENGQLVVTIPVYAGERVSAVVRSSTAVWTLWARVMLAWAAMIGLAAAAVASAVFVARRQATQLAAPLQSVASAAHALGEGDFSARAAGSDVPEIDQTAVALNLTAQRLGDLVTQERAFSANASHQLRTPLTALRLQLEAAIDHPGTDLRPAIGLADDLERTIEDLLLLARGTGPVVGLSGPVDSQLDGLRHRWQAKLAAEGRPLHVAVEPDLPQVYVSGAVLGQLIDILVDNALRHGRGAIEVRFRDAGGAVAMDVSDAGTALAGRTVDIFARGVSGSATGQGIGLALARELALSQGGRLLLTRTSPGTVFTLLVPAADEGTGSDEGTGAD
jgi:signal transduction histidine kinase